MLKSGQHGLILKKKGKKGKRKVKKNIKMYWTAFVFCCSGTLMTVFVTFLHVKSIIIIIIFINISTFGSKTTKMCHSSEGLGLS
jgi:hypothetical protein